MKSKIVVVIIVMIILISLGFYLVSPLFLDKTVDEPLPFNTLTTTINFSEFMAKSENERYDLAKKMDKDQINSIMVQASKTNNQVNEDINDQSNISQNSGFISGNFIGVNDGIHNAQGVAKIIPTNNGTSILRFENFKSTNGPDLYVYLSNHGSTSDIVDLGRLKGNVGNQNYIIPADTDVAKYDTVLIWCKAFSVLFGSAKLA